LLVAAETGLPGLLAFLWVIGSSLRAALIAARSDDPFISETGTILTAIHLALIWALNIDFVAGAETYVLLWFVMGFTHGVRCCAETEAQRGIVRHFPAGHWISRSDFRNHLGDYAAGSRQRRFVR